MKKKNVKYQITYKHRHLKVKPMPTLIIGMYYCNCDGAIIISDSRMMFGPDFSTEQKVFKIIEGVFFSTSGLAGVRDDLISIVQGKANENNIRDLEGLRRLFESEVKDLYYWYQSPPSGRASFPADETLVDGILGGLFANKPKLYHVHQTGYAEPIREGFRSVGDGYRHAHNIIKSLYKPNITRERAMEIGIHAIIQTSKVDSVVDGYPQIAIIERDNLRLLNMNDNGEFSVENQEIARLKQKINGIEEKRSTVFELLLDGAEEIKKKFSDVIEEYRKSKESASP
jgi:20S proteasome alpha/beta subunit